MHISPCYQKSSGAARADRLPVRDDAGAERSHQAGDVSDSSPSDSTSPHLCGVSCDVGTIEGIYLRALPEIVSLRATILSAMHTTQASLHVGGTGTSGNMWRTMTFCSLSVRA